MIFENGNQSPFFQVSATTDEQLKTIPVNTNRDIRYVSMRIKNKYPYTGLRLYDQANNIIVDESWEDVGEWTELREIPLGQHIIGFICDTDSSSFYLLNMSFILGVKGRKYTSGELRFPEMETFPTFEEFKPLLFEDSIPKMFKLNYKTITYRLSGIQVMFTRGYESDML